MAEFPPNLDDGELWLPSVIFPDVGVCRRHHRQAPSAGFSYVDDLAEKLAAFSLLDRSHLLRPKPHLSDLGLRCGNGSFSQFGPVVARETGAGKVYDGFCSPAASRWTMGAAAGGSRSVIPFSLAKPVQVVGAFGQESSRVMSRQQPGPVQGGRFVPVRTGGSGRECGGTGVFLPRVNKIEAAAPTKKKASIKGGGEHQKKQPARNAAIGKQRMPFHQVASEMGLPQDWTY